MWYLKIFVGMFLSFLLVDMLWLGIIAKDFYQRHLEYLLRPSPNWPVAFLFYFIFVAGILVFVVQPGIEAGSWKKTLLMGAFFGLVTYATYDLTNHATVKDWPWIVSVVDITWGVVLCSIVTMTGYFLGRWLV